VEPAEDLLRRLVINDEAVVGEVLSGRVSADHASELGAKIDALVRLAALLAVGAATPSLREAVDRAFTAGASRGEVVAVLVATGPTIGLASLVASAPRLALAMGYDLENGHGRAAGQDANEATHGAGARTR
jgi:4-carboxymuconolactone decarboxylase